MKTRRSRLPATAGATGFFIVGVLIAVWRGSDLVWAISSYAIGAVVFGAVMWRLSRHRENE
jgi:hypothetical protein